VYLTHLLVLTFSMCVCVCGCVYTLGGENLLSSSLYVLVFSILSCSSNLLHTTESLGFPRIQNHHRSRSQGSVRCCRPHSTSGDYLRRRLQHRRSHHIRLRHWSPVMVYLSGVYRQWRPIEPGGYTRSTKLHRSQGPTVDYSPKYTR
jgi:hypothetical protein